MKEDNYIVIMGWMITELGLKGNELLVYALIHGFCQAKGTKFTGSINYISNWTGGSRATAFRTVKSLLEKGLIDKEERVDDFGVKRNLYVTIRSNKGESQNDTTPSQNETNQSQNEIRESQNETNQSQNDTQYYSISTNTNTSNSLKKNDKKENRELVYPFEGDEFLRWWSIWKEYKKKEFRFSFKSKISEQASLTKLSKIAETEEEAIAVIGQSIERGYRGFFKLKKDYVNKTSKKNGISRLFTGENARAAAEELGRSLDQRGYGKHRSKNS